MGNRDRIALFGIIVLLASGASSGQSGDAGDPAFGVEVEAEVVSTYYWRGFNVTGDEPVFQPGITVRHRPSGLWFNLWSSLALKNRQEHRDADEIDFTLALERPLGEAATVTVGALFYLNPRLGVEENSTEELFAGVSLSQAPLQPTVFYFHDFGLGDGGYLELSAGHAWGDLSLEANLGISLGQFTEKKGFTDFVMGAAYDISLGASGFLTPFLKCAVVGDRERNPNRAEFWFGVAVGWDR